MRALQEVALFKTLRPRGTCLRIGKACAVGVSAHAFEDHTDASADAQEEQGNSRTEKAHTVESTQCHGRARAVVA
jgi:hypothetical protein